MTSKVDVLSRLREQAKKHVRQPGPPCGVCSLPKATLEAIRQLKAEGTPNTVLARVLQGEKFPIKSNCVSRHFLDHERNR
jgi:hypothetical protein